MNTEDISIQPAGFEDSPKIVKLIRTYPEALISRPISDIIQNIDRILVAKKNGELVGVVSWKILPEMGSHLEPSVEIMSLAVHPDHKGQGIGSTLVHSVIEDHIRPLHPLQIIALTFAPEFFKKFGFKETPKSELMHKIYMGCIHCTRYDSPFTCPEVAMTLRIHEAKEP